MSGHSAFIRISDVCIPENGRLPVGAVLVVGGGIAGMQASLDLAGQGFKVYLVEQKSAIGGHMAQLDKTFPTNDCAMCTISPKLIETGRHLNIELLTDTEVLAVNGKAGHFTARLRRKPRYVDVNRCTGCGACAEVCPVEIASRFDEGLASQRAAHKLYPQAVPNAYAIDKRGVAPCRDACPAGQRAQGYIALINAGRYAEAMRVIKEDNPFPGICGRICSHRCELACSRGQVDEPLNIHMLKRFAADWAYAQVPEPVLPFPQTREERVAIIGAGPCGLTAAKDLLELGYGVTVFEALPVAGGMLRVGVPEFRLPTAIVEREVQDIVDLGLDLRLNTQVGDLEALFDQGFAAVLLAIGAQEGKRLPIPGADLPDVLVNTRFLRDTRLGAPPDVGGRNVLVLGGGNVAIDCARTAVRLGAASVSMAFLETTDTMPAHAWEVTAAEQEGVRLYPARSFGRIVADGLGRIAGVACLNVTRAEFDAAGGLTLETEPDSEHILPCDLVIFSVGQRVSRALLADTDLKFTSRGTIAANPRTCATAREGVFAAGDATTGTAFVIDAVAAGHRAAAKINRYLRDQPLDVEAARGPAVVQLSQAEIAVRRAHGDITPASRVAVSTIAVETRRASFAEVERGYTEEQARAEAARCLACGHCSECLACVYACGVAAIDHDQVERTEEIEVGAVILAPGYQIYNAALSSEYGLGRYPNVVTSLQYERMLSASGPTRGHIQRPSDGANPKRIAFVQCVGSRDRSHDYCSSVCCMYAAKEAIMTVEHARAGRKASGDGSDCADVTCQVFFMDTRAYSKGYEEYYRRAEQKYGVKYTRCRLSEVRQDPATNNLRVRYAQPYTGRPEIVEEEFDLVVLAVGMEISEPVKQLGRNLGIDLDAYGFCHTTLFDPLQTSRSGIYVAGPFREPKDIPDTVVEASGAAAAAAQLLAPARHTLARKQKYPPERAVRGEEPQVGVFVCHCGTNIGGYLDVRGVAEYARSLPGVVHAEDNLYTCSQDSIAHIIAQVRALQLNRVVVAACTPLTHQPLFQDAIRQAGLNPYLFEMANIRNQCSWVHSGDWGRATAKARSLVRMAVARSAELEPLQTSEVPVKHTALVIGGGVAGMTAALALAEQSFPVQLVEREAALGGNLRRLHYGVPNGASERNGKSPQDFLAQTVDRVTSHPRIDVHLNSELLETTGFKGNFTSTLRRRSADGDGSGQTCQVQHGVTIVATGAVEYRGQEYGYGQDARIMTQLEFEALLADSEVGSNSAGRPDVSPAPLPANVVMIQCVGPGEKYCGRLCCTTALKNALKLKELNPSAQVTVLYRDIRTYGFKERVYSAARRAGVRFIHYDFDRRPTVEVGGPHLRVRVHEPTLDVDLALRPDLLVLSTPVVPSPGAAELATRLKVPLDIDGFFLEAHIKLRPVDFSTDGVFMAGSAHYPKFLDETIAQAQAAASRAAGILSQETMLASAQVALVDQSKCVGCLTCVRVCPYGVPQVDSSRSGVGDLAGAAFIEPAICHGCGSCVAECPAKAIQLLHYTDVQTLSKVDALFEASPAKAEDFAIAARPEFGHE